MPLYSVASKHNLDKKQAYDIACAITNIHCQITGAPPEFVNVVFMAGCKLNKKVKIAINGNIRKGGDRTKKVFNQLSQEIQTKVSDIANTSSKQVGVHLVGIKASWSIEGGMILPTPGGEDAWLAKKNKS